MSTHSSIHQCIHPYIAWISFPFRLRACGCVSVYLSTKFVMITLTCNQGMLSKTADNDDNPSLHTRKVATDWMETVGLELTSRRALSLYGWSKGYLLR